MKAMAHKKLKCVFSNAFFYLNDYFIRNTPPLECLQYFSKATEKNPGYINDQGTILLRICQIVIVVIVLQSIKFSGAPEIHHDWNLSVEFISLERFFNNTIYLHLANVFLHLSVFLIVLLLLKHDHIKLAKYVLLTTFCSYIVFACILWKFNLNIQYYLLLSMFISCYVFNKNEKPNLCLAIMIKTGLFIYLNQSLPSFHYAFNNFSEHKTYLYLHHVSQINTYVFTISCISCALFIRKILAQNWQTLSRYEATQNALLKKVFPAQLMPSLLQIQSKQLLQNDEITSFNKTSWPDLNNTMQTSQQMGVVFVDICQFTQLTISSNNSVNNGNSWQDIYHLFAKFDLSTKHLDAKRIKTNGDQYILLVGLNSQQDSDEKTATQTIQACKQLLLASHLNIKLGAAFGSVTCGIFDANNPNFDIWGETVIRAARLEAIAEANSILVDIHLNTLTKNIFPYSSPKRVYLKGLGEQYAFNIQIRY